MLKISRSNLLSIILILLVVMAAFAPLVSGSFTCKWDMMNQFLPCRHFISECLQYRIFPLWCPYINFGYPFYADPQGGVFYPVTWLISLTTGYNVYTIGLEYVLHVVIAGIAFFYLLKGFNLDNYTSTAFGLVYCLSGVFISNAQHLPWIISLAWMPLILLNFKNIFEQPNAKNALSLALFMALAITGGYPGFFIILFYFFLLYGVVKIAGFIKQKETNKITPLILFFAFTGICFVLLTGGYLYSFIHALPYIARGKPVSVVEANNVAVSPHSMVSFLFPFATGATSFTLDTDISMANIYCGFLMLPLVFIAVVKVRMQFFHKAMLAFAVICLLAAMGKYFFIRTLFYHFLPGMNMLRHAAIFRVFSMLGLVFISASSFGWLISAVRNKTDLGLVKGLLGLYFVLLLAAFAIALYKNAFHVSLPFIFSTASVSDFNLQQSVYAHINTQLVYQLGLLLAFIVVLFIQAIPGNIRALILSGIVVADMFIATQLNLPATVVSDVQTATLQQKLDRLSTEHSIPPLQPMASFTHYSDGSTLPVWYNISFFKKIPAHDGFNSFYLQNVDDLNASAKADSFLKLPVIFFNHNDTKFEIKKFEPGSIEINCKARIADVVHLQQNFYNGWMVYIDNKKEVPQHELASMSAPVAEGAHTIRFEYQQKRVEYMLLLSALSGLLIIGFLLRAKLSAA